MNQVAECNVLESALSQLESTAVNFAYRFINDGKVRLSYIEQTQKLSLEYRERVVTGGMSPSAAAAEVQMIRNEILEAQRLRTSDIGLAKAIKLKKDGLSLNDLSEKYPTDKFGQPFQRLTSSQKNQVYLEIINSSGRPRPSVNAAAQKLTKLGRGLVVVAIGFTGGLVFIYIQCKVRNIFLVAKLLYNS